MLLVKAALALTHSEIAAEETKDYWYLLNVVYRFLYKLKQILSGENLFRQMKIDGKIKFIFEDEDF